MNTPSKRRHDTISGHYTSPLQAKRLRSGESTVSPFASSLDAIYTTEDENSDLFNFPFLMPHGSPIRSPGLTLPPILDEFSLSHTPSYPSDQRLSTLFNPGLSESAQGYHLPLSLSMPSSSPANVPPSISQAALETLYAMPDESSETLGDILASQPISTRTIEETLRELHDDTHHDRLELQEQMDEGKGTPVAYARHEKDYYTFWAEDQERRIVEDPSRSKIPAEPINATKVAHFLAYEAFREKRSPNGVVMPGTQVGSSHVSQCINALEHYRFNRQHQPNYMADSESRRPLRDDSRIKAFEKAAAADKPRRIAEAHARKAAGTTAGTHHSMFISDHQSSPPFSYNSDTYTTLELVTAAIWCLEGHTTAMQIYIGVRDRAMILLSTCTAFRGDNTRSLLLSDLFFRDLPVPAIGEDTSLEALVCLTDQSKTNTTGKLSEHGAFRHRHVELCSVGGIAILLWARFHVLGQGPPDFGVDHSDRSYGEFGRRDWYKLFVFPSTLGFDQEMSYKNHAARVKLIHLKNNINISKVTHAGREKSVMTAREHGASIDDAKALGNWSESGSYGVYDRALSVEALLGAAMFNAKDPRSHFLPRGCLDPPEELMSTIFPWAEEQQVALKIRRHTIGRTAEDYALDQFLKLLIRFRRILLQDAAVLYTKYPTCGIFHHAPFDSLRFREFAATSTSIISEAAAAFRLQTQNLPEHYAKSLQGIFTTTTIQNQQHHATTDARIQDLFNLVSGIAEGGASGGRHRASVPRAVPTMHAASVHAGPAPTLTIASGSTTPAVLSPTAHQNEVLQPLPSAAPAVAPLPSTSSTTSAVISQALSPTHYSITTADPAKAKLQMKAMAAIEAKYGLARVQCHQWTWTEYKSRMDDEWVPQYDFADIASLDVEGVWTEWTTGVNGCLSTQELATGWDAKWRAGNRKSATEASRRKKIITLINDLAKKPHWSPRLALRFLREKYPITSQAECVDFRTTRSFINYLQDSKLSGARIAEIMDAAASFSSKNMTQSSSGGSNL